MSAFKRVFLVGGLAALMITAPASGAAFGTDGSAIVNLDTTGLIDPGLGGGGGGNDCVSTSDIFAIGNGPTAQLSAVTNNGAGETYFTFDSESFPIEWNPDSCGLSGGTLSLTDFKTEALVSGTWRTVYSGLFFNGLPARQANSGVYNLDAGGTFHQVASNPIIATTSANIGSTTTNVKIVETLGVNGSYLPDYSYGTTATFTVLSDN